MKYVVVAALTSLALAAGDPLMPAPEPYEDDYVLVRKDVWDRVDAADQKLEKCERELASADSDIKAMDRVIKSYKMAVDVLKQQKKELKEFGDDQLTIAKAQREYIMDLESYSKSSDPTFADQAANVWEWSDGPVSFAGGFGLCLATVYALQPAFGSSQ